MLGQDAGVLHRTAVLVRRIGTTLRAEGWNILEVDVSTTEQPLQEAAALIVEQLEPLFARCHGSTERVARGRAPRDGCEQRNPSCSK